MILIPKFPLTIQIRFVTPTLASNLPPIITYWHLSLSSERDGMSRVAVTPIAITGRCKPSTPVPVWKCDRCCPRKPYISGTSHSRVEAQVGVSLLSAVTRFMGSPLSLSLLQRGCITRAHDPSNWRDYWHPPSSRPVVEPLYDSLYFYDKLIACIIFIATVGQLSLEGIPNPAQPRAQLQDWEKVFLRLWLGLIN